MKKVSDKELIRKYLLGGDEESLEALIQRHIKSVYNFVLRWVGNSQEAEDITQEVFLKAWRHIKKFNQEKNFRLWLFSIAKNSCIDFLRKNKKNNLPLKDYIADNSSCIINKIEEKQAKNILESALKNLPSEYRMILFLRYNDHLKFKEIAEILEKPLNTIKSYHRRALLLLKKQLKVENY